jgi:predicted DNA-binding transcriptional regulator AlpA
VKVETEDLIDAGEVAEILNLAHRSAVSLYQRRYADMPRPVVVRSGGKTMLWLRTEIMKWAKQTGRIEQ